jgi:mutator protein MutT
MTPPISVKGVLLQGSRVVLLENERGEWELPGGRLEPGEKPEACVIREIAEELGADVAVEDALEPWLYEVIPGRQVKILTYGVRRLDSGPLRISREHRRLGYFSIEELSDLPMPEGYRRSIRHWVAISRTAC